MTSKPTERVEDTPADDRVSLAPLDFEEVVRALLATEPNDAVDDRNGKPAANGKRANGRSH